MMVLCANMSLTVLIFERSKVAQMRVELLALPSHRTLLAGNSALGLSSSKGPVIAPGVTAPMVSPSLGAMVLTWTPALVLPAPGMFFATIVGVPGI